MSEDLVVYQRRESRMKTTMLRRSITGFDILIALILLLSLILSGCGVIPLTSGIAPFPKIEVNWEETLSTVSSPEDARDVAFKFIQTNYKQIATVSISEWTAGEVLSGEFIGGTIYQYSAGDWLAKVIYPLVPPNSTVYTVKIEGGAYGLSWEGLVDLAGQTVTTAVSIDGNSLTPEATASTLTLTATPSPFPTTLTPAAYCDWLTFVKDMTIPDGTALKSGETFVKTWRLKNRGTCTWTPEYALVFSSGSQMGETVAVKLPGYVGPGDTVDVSVTLVAPSTPGNYRGYWMLRNDSGTLFGYGENANEAFYVDIQTVDSSFGTISGKICFPSENIPPLNLYFPNMTRNKRIEVSTYENQLTYQVQLEPGEYLAYAWTRNFELAGGYTDVENRLKAFEVKAGHTLTGIDICDWYGEPGSIPRPSPDQLGSISGILSYPGEQIPPLRVVAFDIYNDAYHWVDTDIHQQTYTIENLMPGYYTIVAYEPHSALAGGYSEFAVCELKPACAEDHTLVTVYIAPGDHLTNINPADWYAPAAAFPTDPTR